jgi:ribonucleotide reductase alpha subunit
MKRVMKNGDWTLFCPDTCKGLTSSWGDDFEELYAKYESEGKGIKTIKARELWNAIIDS